jgi:hypothetical protein
MRWHSGSRVNVFLDDLLEIVNDQQEPANGEVVAGPAISANHRTELF